MSGQIDYIDLTVDSPTVKRLERQTRNSENVSNNSRNTKSRRRIIPKCQTTNLHDSVIEISVDNNCHGEEASVIVDVLVDDVNETEKTGTPCINESNDGNLVALTCPICYEQLCSKLKPMSTRCGHIFCAQCLALALRTTKKCPTCQKTTKFQSCTRLYF